MNADDRKLLKKLLDRDVTRALAILDRQKQRVIDHKIETKSLPELPKGVQRMLGKVNDHCKALFELLQELENLGYDPPREFEFRGYHNDRAYRLPQTFSLGLNPTASAKVRADANAQFQPKVRQIEQAQADTLLNIIAGDLPGMKEELESLRKTLADVVGQAVDSDAE